MGDRSTNFRATRPSSATPAATAGQDRTVAAYKQPELAVASRFGIAHIEHAELDGPEVHLPAIVVDFVEADKFTRKAIREIPLRLAKGDDPVWIRALHAKMRGVVQLRELARVSSSRRHILRRRCLIGQRFVRPLVIVFAEKHREGSLLGPKARSRRPSGLGLQGAVHAFMAAVLIWTSRDNAFGTDAEADPPDGQAR